MVISASQLSYFRRLERDPALDQERRRQLLAQAQKNWVGF